MEKNQIYKFPNGATLIYAPQNVNNITYATIGFSCGAKCDPEDKAGLSHILEHMLFHDTKTVKEEAFQKLIKVTDSKTNAFTSKDCIAFEFNCLNSNFETILKSHSNLVVNRKFDEKMLEKEKKIVLQEKSSSINNSIIGMGIDNLTDEDLPFRLVSGGDKMTIEDILGNENSLNNIHAQDLEKYAKKYFVSENLIISISTKLSFEQVKDYCDKYLVSKLKSNPKNIIKCEEPKYTYIKQDKMILKDVENKETFDIKFIFKNNITNRLDSMKYALLEHYIFQDFDGLLMKELRTKRQITYTSYFQEHKFTNFFLKELDILTDYRHAHEALEATIDILKKLVTKGITKADMNGFYIQMMNKKEVKRYAVKYNTTDLFYSHLQGKKIFDKKDIYNAALKISLDEANKYFRDTYGCSNVGIILSGDMYKVSNIPNFDELLKLEKQIMALPPQFSNEYVMKLLQENVYNYVEKIKLLPTINDIIGGFKLKYVILNEMPNHCKIPASLKNYLFGKVEPTYKLTKQDKEQLKTKLKLQSSAKNKETNNIDEQENIM